MSSGTQLINRAYKKIGVKFNNQDVTAESLEIGREELNSMLEEWQDEGIELNYVPISAPSDETNISQSIENAVVNNLAICLAPYFDDGKNIISPALARKARLGFTRLKKQRKTSTPLTKSISSTAPRGMGNTRGLKPRMFFRGDESLTGGGKSTSGTGSGSGGGGTGPPGPPGPPGPEGPQGPPGSEVFATLAETIAGVVNDKSIAPDTAHGLFASPPNFGTEKSPDIFKAGGWEIAVDIATLTAEMAPNLADSIENILIETFTGDMTFRTVESVALAPPGDIIIESVAPTATPGAVKIQGVNWRLPKPNNNEVPQFKSTGDQVVWEAPHEILSLTEGGDMVYNNVSDVLTRLPIGAEGQVLEVKSNVPAWKDEATGAHKNYIIDGDFSTTGALHPTSLIPVADGAYFTPLFKFLNTGAAIHDSFRLTSSLELPTIAESGHLSHASPEIVVSTADTTIAATDRTTVRYALTGSDFRSLVEKEVTLSFWVYSDLIGIYSVGFQNRGASQSQVKEYTINSAGTWERKTITLTLDVLLNWDTDDANIGLNIFWSLTAGSNFTTSVLNQWNGDAKIASTNQVNFNGSVGDEFRITQVQLVEGNRPPIFTVDNKAVIKKKLEWYVERWDFDSSAASDFALPGVLVTDKFARFVVNFRSEKRIAPLFTGSPLGNWAVNINNAPVGVITSVAFDSTIINKSSATLLTNNAGGYGGAPNVGCFLQSNSAGTFFQLDSRHP